MREDNLPGILHPQLHFDHLGSTPNDLTGISAN